MTTKTSVKEISISGKTIKVSIERGTFEEEINLDGHICGTKTHLIDRLTIEAWDGKKCIASGSGISALLPHHTQAKKAGCVGIIGTNWFVKAETADAIRHAIATCDELNPKTGEMLALEEAEADRRRIGDENMSRMYAEKKARNQHPGWCNKCQSYCYGDCSAN